MKDNLSTYRFHACRVTSEDGGCAKRSMSDWLQNGLKAIEGFFFLAVIKNHTETEISSESHRVTNLLLIHSEESKKITIFYGYLANLNRDI